MEKIFILLLTLLFAACAENKTKTGQASILKTEDANAARTVSVIHTDVVNLQTFEQVPASFKGCTGLFATEVSVATKQYVLANNQKGMAYINLDGQPVELKLIKQTDIDERTVNELYTNGEVEVELKVTQHQNAEEKLWNYKGVLIIRKGGRQEAINISGKLGC